jgi:ribonuclease VapC
MTEQDMENVGDAPGQEVAEKGPEAVRREPGGMPAVLDASALLALLFAEPGAERVADAIAQSAVISTVNLSEVAALLVRRGQDPDKTLDPVREQVAVEPFTADDALSAARFLPHTAQKGLSLGDRACLALAKRLNARAITAERGWSQLELDVDIQLIRR